MIHTANNSDNFRNEMFDTKRTMKDPCIVWSKSPDGKVEALCTIERDASYQQNVCAAENFFNASSRGTHILSFEIGHTAGLGNIRSWRDISDSVTSAHLKRLEDGGVSDASRAQIQVNLNTDASLSRFNELVSSNSVYQARAALIHGAHEVASSAHAMQTYARPQDTEGLFNIPYIQHPRNLAIKAMELSLSPNAVAVALLHDVVEDTHLSINDLQKRFSNEVIDGVRALTKSPEQSKQEFLQHVSQLSGEMAVIKGLDRIDNLHRAFGLADPKYHARVLRECSEVYDSIMEREPLLKPLQPLYETLKTELKRYSAQLA